MARRFLAAWLLGLALLRGWTFLPGARVRGSRRSSSVPRRAAEEDFVEALALLEKAGLGSYKSQLLEWCEEQGAASDEEVLENLEDLAADLGWSSEELEHVQEMQSKQQELFAYARSGDAEGLAKVAPTCDLSKREANGGTALHLAAAAGHGAAVARLLELNAPSLRDKDGRVPLHLAAFQGHHEVLSLLLDSKAAYVDATERRQGSSPLHSAARNGHEACVEALVEGKADLTLRDLMGRDALHWACFWGQPNTAELLIRHKADFSEANRDKGSGAGPLHWAAWRGHGEVLRLLLAQKADPNSNSLQRNTPLHFAAEAGHVAMVTELLEVGSKADAMTDMGETPLMLAMARTEKGHAAPNLAQPVGGNHTAVVQLLDGIETDRGPSAPVRRGE
ncbi:unnamed protein product [Effrenium voratum]|nr:unnamed protein product [Effrenium voratum]